jgi:hypothetical protein
MRLAISARSARHRQKPRKRYLNMDLKKISNGIIRRYRRIWQHFVLRCWYRAVPMLMCSALHEVRKWKPRCKWPVVTAWNRSTSDIRHVQFRGSNLLVLHTCFQDGLTAVVDFQRNGCNASNIRLNSNSSGCIGACTGCFVGDHLYLCYKRYGGRHSRLRP